MSEDKYIYKVVSNWDPERQRGYSATIKIGPCKLKYEIGKVTKPLRGSQGIVCYGSEYEALDNDLKVYGSKAALLKCTFTGLCRKPDYDHWKMYTELWGLTGKTAAFLLFKTYGNAMYLDYKTRVVDTATPVEVVAVWDVRCSQCYNGVMVNVREPVNEVA